jgi:hypothetical protein
MNTPPDAASRSSLALLAGGLVATPALAGFGGLAGAMLSPVIALAQCAPGPAPAVEPAATSATEGRIDNLTGVGKQAVGAPSGTLTVGLIGPAGAVVTGGAVLLNDHGNITDFLLTFGNAASAAQDIVSTGLAQPTVLTAANGGGIGVSGATRFVAKGRPERGSSRGMIRPIEYRPLALAAGIVSASVGAIDRLFGFGWAQRATRS